MTDEDVRLSPWSSTSPQELPAQSTMDMDDDVPTLDTVKPIIEEPTEPTSSIPEIRMRHSSSYEPEKDRIVVTDLDSSEDEEDSTSHNYACDDSFSLSSAFISRVNASSSTVSSILKNVALSSDSDPSRALILFNPSPWSVKDARELENIYHRRDTDKRSLDPVVIEVEELDTADAMDIE
ncbi:hypothetical protein K439DRAFT_1639206 [Ramaria rubella]|nr:hypothetical protein K439DRAFT_1639206 [Ramaria rubella]